MELLKEVGTKLTVVSCPSFRWFKSWTMDTVYAVSNKILMSQRNSAFLSNHMVMSGFSCLYSWYLFCSVIQSRHCVRRSKNWVWLHRRMSLWRCGWLSRGTQTCLHMHKCYKLSHLHISQLVMFISFSQSEHVMLYCLYHKPFLQNLVWTAWHWWTTHMVISSPSPQRYKHDIFANLCFNTCLKIVVANIAK
jgi:hypothetical protein